MKRLLISKILIVLFLIGESIIAYGEENNSSLNIMLKNGDTCVFLLSEHPKVTFVDGYLVFKTNDLSLEQSSYLSSDIRKIWFYEYKSPTFIDNIKKKTFGFEYLNGYDVVITGLVGKPVFSVYSLNGLKVEPACKVTDRGIVLSFSALPKGIYIVSVDKLKFKIRIK